MATGKIQLEEITPFPCNSCGKCCRRVNLSELTIYLDRGDGVCQNFNEVSNLCNVYSERPLICRVEDYYKTYLIDQIGWDDFVKINMNICADL